MKPRDRLVSQAEAGTSFQGIGAGAREVVREIEKLGVRAPHWITIHRILQAAGRIPRRAALGYCPRPVASELNAVHQVDIWPRVLVGGVRVSFFHLVDVACWYPHGLVADNKSTDTALDFLVESWQMVGLPKIAQCDNEMVFTGGRWAHRLGRVVRLCLALGIEAWFIPFYTPERNGYVERFHGETEASFWNRRRFDNPAQVAAAYPDFLAYFRTQRRLPAIQNQTPTEKRTSFTDTPVRLLPSPFDLHHRQKLPLVQGVLHCVRLVDHQGQVNILNHHLVLDTDYAHHYVRAQIDTAAQQMTLYHQEKATAEPQIIQVCPFPLPETALKFQPDFNYPATTL